MRKNVMFYLMIFMLFNSALIFGQQSQLKKFPVHQRFIDFPNSSNVNLFPAGGFLDCQSPYNEQYDGRLARNSVAVGYDPISPNNILFFINDGIIYNRLGSSDDGGNKWVLHENHPGVTGWIEVQNKSRSVLGFDVINPSDICSYQSHIYYHGSEICVVPVPGQCYEYFLFYTVFKQKGGGMFGAGDVYFRTLSYNKTDESFTLTNPVCITKYFDNGNGGGWENSFAKSPSAHLAVTPRNNDGTQFIFVNYMDMLYAYNINDFYGANDTPIPVLSVSVPCNLVGLGDSYREEMEVRLVNENGVNFYYLAFPYLLHGSPTPNFNMIGLYKFNGITAAYIGEKHLNVGIAESGTSNFNNRVKGIELSVDGKKMFYNLQGQSTLNYLDLSFMQNLGAVPSPIAFAAPSGENANDFQFSQIELGWDNALYYINGVTGNLKRFSNSINPFVGSWSTVSGMSGILISNNNNSTSENNYSKHFILCDQIDGGSNFENYSQSFNLNSSFTANAGCINNQMKITVNASVVYPGNQWQIQQCNANGITFGPVIETINTQVNPKILPSIGSLSTGSYYLITHTVTNDCGISSTTTKVVSTIQKTACSFTTSVNCVNNQLTISANGSTNNFDNEWYIYDSDASGNYNPSLPLYSILHQNPANFNQNLLLNHYYIIKHVVINCGTSTCTKLVNTFGFPQLNASFTISSSSASTDVTATASVNYCNTSGVVSSYWRVEELLPDGSSINIMDNSPNWWYCPNLGTNTFPGYNSAFPNNGVFQIGHTYKITYGNWSSCNPWNATSQSFTKYGRGIQLLSIVNDVAMPESMALTNLKLNTENFVMEGLKIIKVYPIPVSEKLFIELALENNEETIIEIFGILGNKVASYKLTNGLNNISVNEISAGIYLYKIINQNNVIQSDRLIIEK